MLYNLINYLLSQESFDIIPNRMAVYQFWNSFKIDSMSIGGIFAVILFNKNKLFRIVCNTAFFYLSLIAVLIFYFANIKFPYFHFTIYSVFFGIIIINFAANSNLKLSLENRILIYLGKTSYGFYMYHPIAIVMTLYICKEIGYLNNWLIYPFSFIISLLFASISYKYIESFFLKFKT